MKTNRVVAPCKDCQDRTIDCHDTCKKYISYKHKRNYIKVKQRAKKLGQSWD